MFYSFKKFDGFSTAFRQPNAKSHCKFLHGYALEFNAYFKGELDSNNWVVDFGGLKEFKEILSYWFDHTIVIDKDDSIMNELKELEAKGYLQLRIMNGVGTEKFAEFVGKALMIYLKKHTGDRVKLDRVECWEHSKNMASFSPNETV